MFLSTVSLIVTSRTSVSPYTFWPGTGALITITGGVVSDTQTFLLAVLLLLLVRSVTDRVTTVGFAGSVVTGAVKLNVDALPTSPVVLDQLNASDFPPVASVVSLASIETRAPSGLLASTQPRVFNGFSKLIRTDLVMGTSELYRIWPNKAGTKPSQCCSQFAASWVMAPVASRTISSTSKRPVEVLQPRPSPVKSSPGFPAAWNGHR